MANFPPAAPQSLLKTIPSYLYWQYNDDQYLQAFVDAYNGMAQGYVDFFNTVNLPVYTGVPISGLLLDWVAAGLYGLTRPNMPLTDDQLIGPYNTATYDRLAYDELKKVLPSGYGPATDDIFKRVITWRYYKGDGQVFSVRWLKRRIMRFLTGVNGTDPGIDQTYDVSVAFGAGNTCTITILNGIGTSQLQFGIESGVLELPFQFAYTVNI